MRHTCLLLLVTTLVGCAGSGPASDPILVGPDAKLDGDIPAAGFLCRVEAGERDDFFASDTVRCESPEGAVFVPTVDVRSNTRGFEGSILLGEGPGSASVPRDGYPLELHAYGRLSDEVAGLAGTRLDTEITIDGADGWETLTGPTLPFDVWTLEIESRVSLAQITFDPYVVESGAGFRFTSMGAEVDALDVRPSTLILRGPESARVSLAAPSDGAPIRGVLVIDRESVPFELDRGGALVVTREGLVPRQGLEPVENGVALVRCERTGPGASCALISRPGVAVSEASVTTDSDTLSLPLDGTALEIPSDALSARVVLADGIEGLDLARYGVIEGELESVDGAATLSLPFALVKLEVTAPDGYLADFDAAERHVVGFSRPIDGAFESADHLSIRFEPSSPDVWIAVSVGQSEIVGRLRVFDGFQYHTHEGVALREGSFAITTEGLVEPTPLDAGAEIARCWMDAEALITCTRTESPFVESARATLLLESFDHELTNDLDPGANPVTSLGGLFPVTLTLDVQLRGGATRSATARLTEMGDLPETGALVVLAP